MRPGGISALFDLGGDDRYEVGGFEQGCGYFYGLGVLHDGAGRDSTASATRRHRRAPGRRNPGRRRGDDAYVQAGCVPRRSLGSDRRLAGRPRGRRSLHGLRSRPRRGGTASDRRLVDLAGKDRTTRRKRKASAERTSTTTTPTSCSRSACCSIAAARRTTTRPAGPTAVTKTGAQPGDAGFDAAACASTVSASQQGLRCRWCVAPALSSPRCARRTRSERVDEALAHHQRSRPAVCLAPRRSTPPLRLRRKSAEELGRCGFRGARFLSRVASKEVAMKLLAVLLSAPLLFAGLVPAPQAQNRPTRRRSPPTSTTKADGAAQVAAALARHKTTSACSCSGARIGVGGAACSTT